jgi:FG-GAP-like repeat
MTLHSRSGLAKWTTVMLSCACLFLLALACPRLTESQTLPAGFCGQRIMADINGDGKADIVAFGDAGVWTALSTGDGGFAPAKFVLANFGREQGWDPSIHVRLLADINGDGKADIVGFGDAGVWTALSTGDGGFAPATFVLANFGVNQGWDPSLHVRLMADINGDGKADIVAFGYAGIWTALSAGGGGFAPEQFVLANFGTEQGWDPSIHVRQVADINGDGKADIVAFGYAGVWTALSAGNGGFAPEKFVLANFGAEQGWFPSLHVRLTADLNGDGKADIIAFGYAGVWTALSAGDGSFAAEHFVLANFGLDHGWDPMEHLRLAADISGDAKADVVAFGDAGVWTALSAGDGSFAAEHFVLADFGVDHGWDPSVHVRLMADVNGDGKADIVAFGDAGVWTALSAGDGSFASQKFVLANFGCTAEAPTVTYHNDAQRTGWNPKESTLTTDNVGPSTFGLIASVPLDDQVDTQPLVVANQMIEGQGELHTVVYVATEGNTVYAIDSSSGSILRTGRLGAPVPEPLGCVNNGPNVGITGTPTIDAHRQTMYVVAYTLIGGQPTYQLHALNISTLEDEPGSPITIAGSHALANGSIFNFDPAVQRQRPALLQSRGKIYAGFGSFCDWKQDKSRGWVLGWNAATLAPLGANELTNTLTTAGGDGCSSGPCYLSSVWMSGYGVAADQSGSPYFVTGNSGAAYTGTSNIQESGVKMSGDLSSVEDLFTPSNVSSLDGGDNDLGSGGMMLLPDQPGLVPHLAAAAGKDGRMFLLNRDDMGGINNPDIPNQVDIGACWCGPSYYKGWDHFGRVVSSGGRSVKTWSIDAGLNPTLTLEATSPTIPGDQDGGFFTSVSSNGLEPGSQIIWAIGRPTGDKHEITLYAFDGTAAGGKLAELWHGEAGTWPSSNANSNLVPTVANGRVYVPSYHQLAIFGLVSPGAAGKLQTPPPPVRPKLPGALYWGTIKTIKGNRITIALRTGKLLQVDLSEAIKESTTVVPIVGQSVAVNGDVSTKGILGARRMWRAKGRASWGEDSAK